MNVARIAALLRELADAIERPEPVKKRKARKLEAPATEPDKETLDSARRALKKAGFAA